MILHCPCCHASFAVDALIQDEAARELLTLRGDLPPTVWPRLIAYLGLFRSETRALAWDRAHRLALEVVEIGAPAAQMESALAETVEAMRQKRDAGDKRPLKNHNYLKRVLESVAIAPPPDSGGGGGGGRSLAARGGKRAQALQLLADWAAGDPIRQEIAGGLQALIALSLDNAPGADTITCTADIWQHVLARSGVTLPEIDASRLQRAFSSLLAKRHNKWPEPAALVELLPRRPDRAKLEAPPPTADEQQRAKGALRDLADAAIGGGKERKP